MQLADLVPVTAEVDYGFESLLLLRRLTASSDSTPLGRNKTSEKGEQKMKKEKEGDQLKCTDGGTSYQYLPSSQE